MSCEYGTHIFSHFALHSERESRSPNTTRPHSWESFSNLWVRMKKPLGTDEANQPMELFNLVDFLYTDMIHGKDGGRIHSNKLLQVNLLHVICEMGP